MGPEPSTGGRAAQGCSGRSAAPRGWRRVLGGSKHQGSEDADAREFSQDKRETKSKMRRGHALSISDIFYRLSRTRRHEP